MFAKKLSNRILFFVTLNAVLYGVFTYLNVRDMYGFVADVLKYASIASCFVLSLLAHERPWRDRDAKLQIVCFLFTLGADFALLFTDRFALGVTIFFGAHLTALLRYAPRPLFLVGLAISAYHIACAYALPMLYPADIPQADVLCVGYGILIFLVTAAAFRCKQPKANNALSRLGMCLFIACDVHVALYNNLPPDAPYLRTAFLLMWVFYLPAQTMLSLSAARITRPKRMRKNSMA
ncbi:MAG: lysoplasmalogenase family protein [Clostridiales Family XIII bacterium]|jgi:hypothetical protein|nr:lysoplasmalogenase family protein [Clostridiales Family XIII bacterium]